MLGGQAEQFQQRLLADLFAGQIFGRIFRGDEFVPFRAPNAVIDAVQDSNQPVGATAHNAVESVAVLACLNLLRVFAADGGEVVGKNQTTFQEIDVAEKFDSAGMEYAHGNAGALQRVSAKQTVITHVVNGEDNWDIPDERIVA